MNKIGLITGCSIGIAAARQFINEGDKVVVIRLSRQLHGPCFNRSRRRRFPPRNPGLTLDHEVNAVARRRKRSKPA